MKRGRQPKPCPISYDVLRAEWTAEPRLTAFVQKYGAGRKSVQRWLENAGIAYETKPRPPPRPYRRLNKSSTIMVDFRGERLPLFVLADRFGLAKHIVRSRVRMQGWTVERALTTPIASPRR